MASSNTILIETEGQMFLSDPDLLAWSPAPQEASVDARWSMPTSALPKTVKEKALATHGVGVISQHRFIADLHSGRVFGAIGPYIMDLAAILLILLSGTGVYMWWRQRSAHITRPKQ